MKKYLFILALTISCMSCHARSHHHPHRFIWRGSVVPHIIVQKPKTVTVVNKLSSRDRLNMALGFLKLHGEMNVKDYAKMTGMSKASSEAELDAFAMERDLPIEMTWKGKSKVYRIRQHADGDK